jgi:ribosome-associated translation inhibitor RaiA
MKSEISQPKQTLKLTLRHFHVRSTHELDSWVEARMFSLLPRLKIEEAIVCLEHRHELSPAFLVRVHLVTPGPDLQAEGRDHTLRAAFEKVMLALDQKIDDRDLKRTRRIKSNLEEPAHRRAVGHGARSSGRLGGLVAARA